MPGTDPGASPLAHVRPDTPSQVPVVQLTHPACACIHNPKTVCGPVPL